MKTLLAQTQVPLGTIGGEGLGPFGNRIWGQGPLAAVNDFILILSNIIGVMTIVAGIWFIFQFIIGGFGWLTAGGDKTAVENAQKRITNALIGLVIVIAAIFLIDLIGNLLGFKVLNPREVIYKMWPGGQ
ncbi:hypothetical protein COU95_01055 [Candidatus Shapirobacteria bacterium CG10_big_fil_rev_8_21_14_0_10_40_9]|uniref:Uncharacterized protein n=1 Tax=Candidatus Shapirobacteria bacterium CG10_big_fil_rev_8_21_14_0_10_40_9 TaxID=1974888 RepID=A0A2M8L422_9BACT|nr:MAG: hypothetical protein COU95_01055 [Candidatus Shapirobacteria bacterium CG10_big_fil_rev_8_21_14_0_10_40_9]